MWITKYKDFCANMDCCSFQHEARVYEIEGVKAEAPGTINDILHKDVPGKSFPANEVIQARKEGTLHDLLPSGTEFPVQFSDGEPNILVVCRDERHTYLLMKYIMWEPYRMNAEPTNKGGWRDSGMRVHVKEVYDRLPEDIKRAVIPMTIRQELRDGNIAECEDMAFLPSLTNVFGKELEYPDPDLDGAQIDIFNVRNNRRKSINGTSMNSYWWLRSAYTSGGCDSTLDYDFRLVSSNGAVWHGDIASSPGGVVVAFCIETRN